MLARRLCPTPTPGPEPSLTITEIDHLAVGARRTLAATLTDLPGGGEYTWRCQNACTLDPERYPAFVIDDGQGGTFQISGNYPSVTIVALGPSCHLDAERIAASYAVPPVGQGAGVEAADVFTAFAVGLDAPAMKEINWNDNGPANSKSDRRDSGVPNDSVTTVSADPDFAHVTISLAPSGPGGIEDATVAFSQFDESDRAAIWANPDRSGARVTGSLAINASDLPKTLYLEGIYPNTLAGDGSIAGSVGLRASCTLDDSTALATASVRQYLDANCTFYTLVHEDDAGYRNESATTETIHIGPTGNTQVNHPLKPTFVGDAQNAGTGRMLSAPEGYSGYVYLKYEPAKEDPYRPSRLYASEQHTGAYGVMKNNAVAKFKEPNGSGALSAFDRNTDVHIPRLQEEAQVLATNAQQRGYDLNWIIPLLDEDREVLDNGTGGTRWLDIFVKYVPPESRSESCRTKSMRKYLQELGAIGSIRASWE